MLVIRNLLCSAVLAFASTTAVFSNPAPFKTATYSPESTVSEAAATQQNVYATSLFKHGAPAYDSTVERPNDLLAEIGVYLMIVAVYYWYFLKNSQ